MRLTILLLALVIILYLIMRQLENVAPTEEAKIGRTEGTHTEAAGVGHMYSKELGKARSLEQELQDQLDKRMEDADALAR